MVGRYRGVQQIHLAERIESSRETKQRRYVRPSWEAPTPIGNSASEEFFYHFQETAKKPFKRDR